ncbi:flagellar assembly protein FliX [Paucidesulfovibrio longus]|uniref:flagellar assembly protein FliX n=1 Tax=Paucidesulfovibrio longus TaxID=889 RepID=UPI0003B710DC|nr:flagellar assembly protein FliX [Paucidesulfovibrio longus]
MKIHPDQIEGVRQSQQQQQADKAKQTTKAFGDVLGQEVAKTGEASSASGVMSLAPLAGVNPLLNVQAVQQVQSVDTEQAAAKVDDVLDRVEDYAAKLRGVAPDGSGLREAHAALQDMQGQVDGLKDVAKNQPGLQSIVNELDVLTRTEQFKFNRGDYLV